MKIIAIRPAPPGGGNAVARFDVQLDGGIRLFNLKLSRGPAGLRVHAASAFGSATATFAPASGAALARLAADALGDIRHDDRTEAA